MYVHGRTTTTSLPDNAKNRQFTDRLAEVLHLSYCTVTGDASRASLRSAHLGKCKFVFISSECDLHFKVRADDADVIVWLSTAGIIRFHLNHELVSCSPRTGCILPTSEQVRIVLTEKHESLAIRVDRVYLELELSRLLGRPVREPIEFSPWLKVDTPRNILASLLTFIQESVGQREASIVDSPILSLATERLFLHALLTSQTSNYSDALNGLNVVVVPRHLRAVMRAIRANPESPWHLTDMATEAGVSVRAICESFRRFCACTPKQFVQTVRLARVRQALLAEAKAGSIAMIAAQCGFQHPGRFASTYYKTYGETPSQTLRQAESTDI